MEPNDVQRRFSDGDAAWWASRVGELEDGPGVRIGAAIHSVRAVDPASAAAVVDWVGERPLHAHVSEQAAENEACLDAYGLTPTEVLADAGAISDRFTAVHGTQLAEEDIGRLGAAGATCCLCPTTERDLADGIGPARAMIDAGARLALGSDSHALIDLFEEARAVELDERLAPSRPPRCCGRQRRMATRASAGPMPGGSRPAPGRTSSLSGSARSGSPARIGRAHSPRSSSPRRPPTCGR